MTPGTDVLEFVELFDGGVGGTSLDGLVLVFYNGSDDLSYAAYDLDGFRHRFEWLFPSWVTRVWYRLLASCLERNGLQNGADDG